MREVLRGIYDFLAVISPSVTAFAYESLDPITNPATTTTRLNQTGTTSQPIALDAEQRYTRARICCLLVFATTHSGLVRYHIIGFARTKLYGQLRIEDPELDIFTNDKRCAHNAYGLHI